MLKYTFLKVFKIRTVNNIRRSIIHNPRVSNNLNNLLAQFNEVHFVGMGKCVINIQHIHRIIPSNTYYILTLVKYSPRYRT